MLVTARVDVDKLVETEIPPLPSSAMRVATLTQDVNASTRKIADEIGYDPSLATKVLRAANSPLYAQTRRVTALPAAVNTLGNNTIYMLVMAYATADAFDADQRSPVEQMLWRHSLAVGTAARSLSGALGMRGGEEAFLCGLLHDIGKLLLLRYDARTYEEVQQCADESALLEREQAAYGYTHAQVGALVAKRWGLPEEISYVIYHHHQPGDAAHSMLTARIVDVADSLANRAGIGARDERERDLTHTESVIALRLTSEQMDEAWRHTESSLQEMMSLLR